MMIIFNWSVSYTHFHHLTRLPSISWTLLSFLFRAHHRDFFLSHSMNVKLLWNYYQNHISISGEYLLCIRSSVAVSTVLNSLKEPLFLCPLANIIKRLITTHQSQASNQHTQNDVVQEQNVLFVIFFFA